MKLVYLFFCLFVISCGNNNQVPAGEPNTAAAPQQQYQILEGVFSAAQITQAFADNEVKADADFKNKMLYANGTIHAITNRDGKAVVQLTGHNGFSTLDCIMGDNNEAMQLKKGDTITLFGGCVGMELMDATMVGCKIATP